MFPFHRDPEQARIGSAGPSGPRGRHPAGGPVVDDHGADAAAVEFGRLLVRAVRNVIHR